MEWGDYMSKGTLKKKKVEIITVCICVVLIAAILAILIVFNKSKDFVYNKHLDEAVISIDDENITLKDFSYYIYIVEKQINDMAIKYNPDDPNDFWNTHFKNSLDSVFTRDYAKQLAKDLCEYDYIMEKETAIHNIYVTESEKESIKADAKDTYDDFHKKLRTTQGLVRKIYIIYYAVESLLKSMLLGQHNRLRVMALQEIVHHCLIMMENIIKR